MNDTELAAILASSLEEKSQLIKTWNLAYRQGDALVDDSVYDAVLESLPKEAPLQEQIGFEVSDSRKTPLPIPMFSMDKIKTMDELKAWKTSKKIFDHDDVVITPKYDGLSFLIHSDTGKAFTRGNGIEGQRSDEHFDRLSQNKTMNLSMDLMDRYLIGEVIMPRQTFALKYKEDYRNPRNLVAGLFNSKKAEAALEDVHFLAYGLGDERESKSQALDMLNAYNDLPVPFRRCKMGELKEEDLQQWFLDWNQDFEIDGLIIEIDDHERRKNLGREKNNNPCYARAWKGFAASSKVTTILAHQFQISKDGRLTAVGNLDPIELDGVTVSNVSLYNASMIEAQGWGVGAKVKVIRSGMVIPKIIATLEPVVPNLPDTCPSCQELLSWDANRVQLVCRQPSYCPAQQVQSAISFFNVLGIEEVGDKIVEQLYESGFNSIAKICSMSIEDFENLDRFASKRAKLIHDHIHAKLQNIELEKIQHASGCFKGLGSKRLALCNRFDAPDKKPELEAVLSIDGFSDITARAYLKGFDLFWAFVQDLPITIRTPEAKSDNGTCQNYKFCFTGYRDKTAQAQIEKEGGEVGSSVTGKTTHVVAKDPSGSSSKLKKARDLGLPIWTPAELMEFLNS